MTSDAQVVDTERAQPLPGLSALALLQEESFKNIIAAYIMEFSIAAHSIIIEVNLGLLGEDDISSIVALMIVMGFHQAVEGFGLGAQIAASYFGGSEAGLVGLYTRKVLLFIIVFVCSTPLDVMIGMLSQSQEETDAQIVAKGAAEAIGTGRLLDHASLAGLLQPSSNADTVSSKDGPGLPDRGGGTKTMIQILSVSLGVAFMAVIAVWA
eukprot:gene36575-47657_t